MDWIMVLRPLVSLLAGMLTLAGFAVTNGSLSFEAWHVALTVAVIAMSTMAWNDYEDRNADLLKNKSFASEHETELFKFCNYWWLASISLAISLSLHSVWWSGLAAIQIAAGYYYNLSRRRALVNNLWTAGTAALSLGYPLIDRGWHGPTVMIALLCLGIITAREMLKDVEDVKYDRHHKATVPIRFGPAVAVGVSIGLICAVAVCAIICRTSTGTAITAFFASALIIGTTDRLRLGKAVLDLGIAAFLLGIIIQNH